MGAAAGAVAGPILGGIIGNIAGQGDRDAAGRASAEAFQLINQVGAPPNLAKEILLEKFKQAGILTPQLEQEINIGASKVAQIQENPELYKAQIQALQSLQERGRTGLGAQERAELSQIRRNLGTEAEAKRQQILQNMQARGMGGSGAELIAQLQSSQSSANDANMQGEQLGALASQRALEALQTSGQLAGQIRGQDFDVARAKAQAEDEFKRFQATEQMNRQQRNVASQNEAQAANLSNLQDISNKNVAMGNAEKERQVNAKRQFWLDKLNQAQGLAGVKMNEAQQHQADAAATGQMWSGIGSGIGSGFGAYQNQQNFNSLMNKQFPTTPVVNQSEKDLAAMANQQELQAGGQPMFGNIKKLGFRH